MLISCRLADSYDFCNYKLYLLRDQFKTMLPWRMIFLEKYKTNYPNYGLRILVVGMNQFDSIKWFNGSIKNVFFTNTFCQIRTVWLNHCLHLSIVLVDIASSLILFSIRRRCWCRFSPAAVAAATSLNSALRTGSLSKRFTTVLYADPAFSVGLRKGE